MDRLHLHRGRDCPFNPLRRLRLAVTRTVFRPGRGSELVERLGNIDLKRPVKWLVSAICAAVLLKAAGWL